MLPRPSRNSAAPRWPVATYGLIALNTAMFLAASARPYDSVFLIGVIPRHPTVTALVTSLFVHASPAQLVVNLVLLWLFARAVEAEMGPLIFLAFYLLGGLFASALQVYAVLAFLPNEETWPIVGTSGAVAGVVGYFAVRHPHWKLTAAGWSSQPVRGAGLSALACAAVLLVTQLAGALATAVAGQSDVAYWGHLGGLALGAVVAITVGPRPAAATSGRRLEEARSVAAGGDLWRAASLYQQALRGRKASAEGWLELARVQQRLGDTETATAAFQTAVETGLAQGEAKATGAAFEGLQGLGRLDRLTSSQQVRVGCALADAGLLASAQAVLRAVADSCASEDDAAGALFHLGRILGASGEPDEAGKLVWEELIRRYPHCRWSAGIRRWLSEKRTTSG